MTVTLATVPLTAYFTSAAGASAGGIIGIQKGKGVKELVYNGGGFDPRNYTTGEKLKEIVVYSSMGALAGFVGGLTVDFVSRVAMAALSAFANLAMRLGSAVANQMPTVTAMVTFVAGEASKTVAANPIGVAIVAGALVPIALYALWSRRSENVI